MDINLYEMIFKRKSFHLFRNTGTEHISAHQLDNIREKFKSLEPLNKNIKVDIEIVPAKETTCKRGEEYCILLYSEEKDNYLQNIGYIGEQLDLYLASMNIGALWYGIGKPEHRMLKNLNFVIMIAIKKTDSDNFRKDMYKSKRKPLDEIWIGDTIEHVSNVIRFAPSACNTQPWIVENTNNTLSVYRYKKPGKRGLMPADRVTFYNRIDMGIFLCFMELCLNHENIYYKRELCYDSQDDSKVLTAEYRLLS